MHGLLKEYRCGELLVLIEKDILFKLKYVWIFHWLILFTSLADETETGSAVEGLSTDGRIQHHIDIFRESFRTLE